MARKKKKNPKDDINIPGRAALGGGLGALGGEFVGAVGGGLAGMNVARGADWETQAAGAFVGGALGYVLGGAVGGGLGGRAAVPDEYKRGATIGGAAGGALSPVTGALGAAIGAGQMKQKRLNNPVLKKDAIADFREFALPEIEAIEDRQGQSHPDLPLRRQAWNEYVDILYLEGRITDLQRDTWVMPKTFEKKRRLHNPNCGPGENLIKREGYRREDGTYVDPTQYCAKDRGSKGVTSFGAKQGKRSRDKIDPDTGKPYAPLITREGKLGGAGYTDRPERTRHQILNDCVQNYGYRSCLGSLQVLLNTSTIKGKTRKVLQSDKKWLMGKYGGPGSESNPCGGYHAPEKEMRALKNRLLK